MVIVTMGKIKTNVHDIIYRNRCAVMKDIIAAVGRIDAIKIVREMIKQGKIVKVYKGVYCLPSVTKVQDIQPIIEKDFTHFLPILLNGIEINVGLLIDMCNNIRCLQCTGIIAKKIYNMWLQGIPVQILRPIYLRELLKCIERRKTE